MCAYFTPTRQPQAFWPDTRHHAPRSTTVWVGFYIQTFHQTPDTTKPQQYWQACGCIHLAVYKCVLILHPPANPRLFGQTPHTTNHKSIGRLVAVYIWLFTNACLFYTHPPTPGFLARHHKPQEYWQACGCIQMRAYFKPTRQPHAFWPDTTRHKPPQYWQACGCIHLAVYKCVLILHPPANPRLFGQTPHTTNHNSIGRLVAVYRCVLILHPPTPGFLARHHAPRSTTVWVVFYIQTIHHTPQITTVLAGLWLYTDACLFYTRPPTPGFLARHHAPRSTTVWVGFYIQTFHQTPHTTATIAWVSLHGCIQMLAYFTPSLQPSAFYQTPRTTVYYSVGKFLNPKLFPRHHTPRLQ